MSTMMQAVALLLLVVAHIGNADSNVAVQQDFQLLCSTPDYAVTLSPAWVVVSTTVFDLSLTTAKIRARHRLLKYFRGANDQGVEMPVPTDSVIQTYVPSDLFREVTLAMGIPTKVWENIPKPLDSKVRIDKIPRNIGYVRNLKNRAALGFSAEREAKKLFAALKKSGDPFSDDDYYYIMQTKSPENGRTITQVAVFALSDRTLDIYSQAEGIEKTIRLRTPACVQKISPEEWQKMEERSQKNVDAEVDLTRVEAGENYCNDPLCPVYNVVQKYDSPLEKREYTSTMSLVFAAAPTCHLRAAFGMAQRAIYDKLNAAGLMKGKPFQVFGAVRGQIHQIKAGEDECNKVFTQAIPVPEAVLASEKLPDGPNQEPYDQDVVLDLKVHRRDYVGPTTYYARHFGGYADEKEIYRQGKALMEDLDRRGLCYFPNTLEFVEYNRASRLFDRHNEVAFYAYPLSCKPEKPSFFLPMNLDLPSRSDEPNPLDMLLPSLDDLCRNNDCVKRQSVRRFENFVEEKLETPGSSVCATQKYCTSVREAAKQAISKLLSYFNGYNKQQKRMDMPRPLFHYINLTSNAKPGCDKEMMTCSFVPKRFAADPPAPADKDIMMFGATELNGYTMPYGDLNDKDIVRTMIGFNKTLAGLEKFGIAYDKLTFGIMQYFAPGEEFTYNALFVPKLQKGIVVPEEDWAEATVAAKEGSHQLHNFVKDLGDNIQEIRMNAKLYACVDVESCNDFFTRNTMVALHDYFAGNNDGNKNLGRLSPMIYHTTRPKIEGCSHGLASCSAIPEKFYENTPQPSDERVTIFNATEMSTASYATTVQERPFGKEEWRAILTNFGKTLTEKGLLFSEHAAFFFKESHMFDKSDEPMYVAFWKKDAESDSEMAAEEDKEMPTEGPADEKKEDDEKAQEMPTALSDAPSNTAMPDQADDAAVPATEAAATGSSAETEER
ncbi:uncharacterized protein [Branchiostoma lanceolatum]|uniref:uncharacterized protein n=1 Tax=Branchiostoma lanceolatum TaxID=7740 RepID=UPI0034519D5C